MPRGRLGQSAKQSDPCRATAAATATATATQRAALIGRQAYPVREKGDTIARSMKPGVAIIFTGGTIAMKVDEARGGAVPALSGSDLLKLVPGIERVASIEPFDFACLPGPHMTPVRMLDLAR